MTLHFAAITPSSSFQFTELDDYSVSFSFVKFSYVWVGLILHTVTVQHLKT